jgi:hypothetical protein
MQSRLFEQVGGVCAGLAGLAGFGYSTAFVIYLHNASRGAAYVDDVLLVLGGLAATAAFVAVYGRLRATDEGFALLGLLLAFAGAFGSMSHGAYDLANLVKPPAVLASDVPSATDPRGLGTFALVGISVAIASFLILRGGALPRALGYLGLVAAALLVFTYVGRLVILNPHDTALHTAAVVSGFLVNPAWFLWLGAVLWRSRPATAAAPLPNGVVTA